MTGSVQSANDGLSNDNSLRGAIETISNGLYHIVDGNLDYEIQTASDDASVKKLELLVNFVLKSLRRFILELQKQKSEAINDLVLRKNLVDQLFQAQKLESLGRLTAGIAQEIDMPTQAIGDNTRFLKEAFREIVRLLPEYEELRNAFQDNEHIKDHIQRMTDSAEEVHLEHLYKEIPEAIEQSLVGIKRVSEVVHAMQQVTLQSGEEKTCHDINKTLETAITVCRSEWKHVAEVRTDFDANLPPVPCLVGELSQAILNLLVNAAHAIAEKNKQNKDDKKGTIEVHTCLQVDVVEISVADTGVGISEQLKDRLFDPFFTADEMGRGGCHGLAIVHSVIVDKHAGSIEIDSTEGEGATFIIRLPVGEIDCK